LRIAAPFICSVCRIYRFHGGRSALRSGCRLYTALQAPASPAIHPCLPPGGRERRVFHFYTSGTYARCYSSAAPSALLLLAPPYWLPYYHTPYEGGIGSMLHALFTDFTFLLYAALLV